MGNLRGIKTSAKGRALALLPSPNAHRKTGQVKVPTLSIVIPLLNEASILTRTYAEVREVLEGLKETYELIFVNDGSTDGSREILEGFAKKDAKVVVIHLARNFGHEVATTAGLRHARGKAAVILDADLQDPPELIEDFVNKWRQGFEVVYGVRRGRRGETFLKKVTSFLFYRLMAKISDVPMPRDTGDFRLVDRRVIDVFSGLSENPRFFRGMISWIGFRQTGIPFQRRARIGGVSKYRYGKLIGLAFDTITSFSLFPAQGVLFLASLVAIASGVAIAVILARASIGSLAMGPWEWLQILLLIVFNLNFISLAVLGQYIVRTHRNTQGRPLYTVDTLTRDAKA